MAAVCLSRARFLRNMPAGLCLLLGSCAVGLLLCEVSLQLFYPKYRPLVEAQFRLDMRRLFDRIPDSRDMQTHPDTVVPHAVHHNNLALRQHRNFSEADLASAINIGVFGDSFVENVFMAAPYSFTEPLDYLLNQRRQSFNVLNFGVNGYGPGQSFLRYEHFRYAEHLDHVFFVYHQSDLENLSATELFRLDDTGQLVRNEGIRKTWWAPLIARLHISYLILDVSGRWFPFRQRSLSRDLKNLRTLLVQVTRHWKHLAEHHGSTFSVVLLPTQPEPVLSDLLTAEGVEVIDLYDCFRDVDPAHSRRLWSQSPYTFKNDGHWNEAGNRLAAVCLYRALEEKRGLPPLSEGHLQAALFRYYAAFEGEPSLKAGEGGAEGAGAPETAVAIREKYLALETQDPPLLRDLKAEIGELVAQPDKRVIASDFDVYLDRNKLIYVKEDCDWMLDAAFFLHVIPIDESDLPEHRYLWGYDNLDFRHVGLELDDKTCVVRRSLPAYAIRSIGTGQFFPGEGRLWEGKFAMKQAPPSIEQRAGN